MTDSFSPVDPKLIDSRPPDSELTDGHSGYTDEQKAGDTRDVLMQVCGSASRAFPSSMWIEPNKWAEKAKENDEHHTWGMNYLDRYGNQTPTHECTTFSLVANCEAARNRQRGIIFPRGPVKDFRYDESSRGSVWLSPLSVYCEANPRQWGGANVRQVLEIACRRGILPDKMQPHDYKFKHSLHGTTGRGGKNQASGPWVRLGDLPDGWEETGGLLMPEEVVFPESFEQAVCLVLNGVLCSVGRDGHAVPWGQLRFKGVDLAGADYPDSYDLTRHDSVGKMRSAWRGSFGVLTMKPPNKSWLDPAGVLAT